jgi:hypothetical protein
MYGMQTYQNMSWKDLQDQYSTNLQQLETSINSIKESSNEIKKIYSQVMEKSKDDPVETRKNFVTLWLKRMNIEDTEPFSTIKDDYDTFLNGPKPSVSDFKNFELYLDQKLYQKSISFLEAYHKSMNEFFSTWKEMWKNR